MGSDLLRGEMGEEGVGFPAGAKDADVLVRMFVQQGQDLRPLICGEFLDEGEEFRIVLCICPGQIGTGFSHSLPYAGKAGFHRIV